MNTVNRVLLFTVTLLACGWITLSQSRGGNWPTYGGDSQRSGWEGADASITKDSVKDLQLLWKVKLETQSRGMRPVMPPVIQGRLISYRGFKELAFVATNSDIVYAIDADLGTIFWQKHLEYSVREPQVKTSSSACPGGLTAMPTMPVPARGAAARGGPAPPATAQRGSAFIGGPASVYALSSDGRLHRLNTSTGDDMTQPVSVLPANARATSLSMVDNVIYTVTSHECNGAPNAVWAIDLNMDPPKVRSFALSGGTSWSIGGPVIGGTGAVHIQTAARVDSTEQWTAGVHSLTPVELKARFDSPADRSGAADSADFGNLINVASPILFTYKDRELIASVCSSNRLCLSDSASVDVAVPQTPQPVRTSPIVQVGRGLSGLVERGIWGSLSSWQDADGTRWVLGAVTGPLHPDLKVPMTNGLTPNGSIVAFRVQEQAGKMALEPAWVSRDLDSPLPPVIANGVVFALSAGEFTRQLKSTDGDTAVDERAKGSSHATLYALDARTGRELYSSRNLVAVPASLTGLTVANGRVYFGGVDGSFYAFGMYMER